MPVVSDLIPRRHGEGQRHDLPREDAVVGVDELEPHLVLARGQPGHVHRVVVARVRPPLGKVVDGDVQVPDPR